VALPLNRASLQPADARAFKGLKLDLRGREGPVTVVVTTQGGRWTKDIPAGDAWRAVEVPFAELKAEGGRRDPAGSWRGDDLLEVGVVGRGSGGERFWMEIDNVAFY
jgi:hypothetical protein